MTIIKKKLLDDISKKIEKLEQQVSKDLKEKLDFEENEKLQRFEFYHAIRFEKYLLQGGDPTFGNLDVYEQTAEEIEYHLSHYLSDYTPEERYLNQEEMYYFHPSYIEMEGIQDWSMRAKAKYYNGAQCVKIVHTLKKADG